MINWKNLKENPAKEAARLCSISTADLDQALENNAAIYAYVNTKYQIAEAEEAKLEWQYEQALSHAFSALRDDGEAIGSAKEKRELDDDVINIKKKILKAERKRRVLWALVKGLESREQMLIQLAKRP